MLTFDDGFASNRAVTENILNNIDIKAVFFICTDIIGLNRTKAKNFIHERLFPIEHFSTQFEENRSPLEWTDLHWLLKQRHHIGDTTSHVYLS